MSYVLYIYIYIYILHVLYMCTLMWFYKHQHDNRTFLLLPTYTQISCSFTQNHIKLNSSTCFERNPLICNLREWTRNLCIKLVIIKKLYYDARSTKYHDNRVRSKLFAACQRWWFQWRFWFVPPVPGYLREEEEHKADTWRNPIERNHMGLYLENEVARRVASVETPTITFNP